MADRPNTDHIYRTMLFRHQYDDGGTRVPDSFAPILLELMHLADEYAVDWKGDLEQAQSDYAAQTMEAQTND
jgi:hypothetical protein